MSKEKKSLPKQILSGLTGGVVMSLLAVVIMGTGITVNSNIIESNALKDCETPQTYNNLIEYGLIDPAVTSPETVKDNCRTIKPRAKALLKKYGADNNLPLFITGEFSSFCGEMTVGCVQNHYGAHEALPVVMSISFTADYYGGLEDTVAHEYVHVLTSAKETKKLKKDAPEKWTTLTVLDDGTVGLEAIDPVEGVADCGRFYFTGEEPKAGSYMSECSQEQIEIANAVIEDRY